VQALHSASPCRALRSLRGSAVVHGPTDALSPCAQAYIMDTNEEERAKGKTVEARPRSFAPAAHAQQRCAV